MWIIATRLVTTVLLASALATVAYADCTLGEKVTLPGQKHAYKLADGSIVFLGRLTVDADGSPRAYNPKSKLGLDALGNGGEPGNWWAIATHTCKKDGKPVVQGEGDPAPGFYVSMTTMTDPAIDGCRNPAKFVDSEKIPYVALPKGIARYDFSKNEGNLSVALAPSGKTALGVFADIAPSSGIGEGSILFTSQLGYNSDPRTGGTQVREIAYLVLPTKMSFPKSADAVVEKAQPAFDQWGGRARLEECSTALEQAPK